MTTLAIFLALGAYAEPDASLLPVSEPAALPAGDPFPADPGLVSPRAVHFEGTRFRGDVYTRGVAAGFWLGVTLRCEGGEVDLPAVKLSGPAPMRHRYDADVGRACDSLMAAVWSDKVTPCEGQNPGCAAYGYALDYVSTYRPEGFSYPQAVFYRGDAWFPYLGGGDLSVQVLDGGSGMGRVESTGHTLERELGRILAATGSRVTLTTGSASHPREWGHRDVLWRDDFAEGLLVAQILGCYDWPTSDIYPCEVRQWAGAPADVVVVQGGWPWGGE